MKQFLTKHKLSNLFTEVTLSNQNKYEQTLLDDSLSQKITNLPDKLSILATSNSQYIF
jgi:hypothetical protein